jgi:hypothetical protein
VHIVEVALLDFFQKSPSHFQGSNASACAVQNPSHNHILSTFVTAFPSLTHLGLSSTRASTDVSIE